MKYDIVLFLMAGIFYACDNNDDNTPANADPELLGTWNLIEVYFDQGTGGGSFLSVETDKQVTFHNDGRVSSNGDLCSMSTVANKVTVGTYNLTDSTISSPDCPEYDSRFEYSGNILIISYSCDEPCQIKYEKAE